jgi:cardiolipin synthase A/B
MPTLENSEPETILKPRVSHIRLPLRILADQAFSRAAGAPLIGGNTARILKDAKDNYSEWLEAVKTARERIHFESYIIHGDEIGEVFAEALAAKARQGVHVRLIYDWVGALGTHSRRLWKFLRRNGAEVRCFNRFHFDSPLGWLNRDHRKMLSVDGCVGFVTGLCVGRYWVGDPRHGVEAWRDTGLMIQGPAVAEIERAFAEMWSLLGSPVPAYERVEQDDIPRLGNVGLRVVASSPYTAGLYRLDQLIAAIARRSIWLTDAYFLATAPYIQSLSAAAADGVDVRLLLPKGGDIPLLRSLSRVGYRRLLEAGVRIFEWNGAMLHAKTAVVDTRWARIGSSNLNVASWLGNYELDVVVENRRFGEEMEQMYLEDLNHATEVVLTSKHRVRVAGNERKKVLRGRRGSAGRAVRGLLRVGNTVSAAMTSRQPLGPAEVAVLLPSAVLLLCAAIVAVVWPKVISWPLGFFGLWLAIALLIKAVRLHRKHRISLETLH